MPNIVLIQRYFFAITQFPNKKCFAVDDISNRQVCLKNLTKSMIFIKKLYSYRKISDIYKIMLQKCSSAIARDIKVHDNIMFRKHGFALSQ